MKPPVNQPALEAATTRLRALALSTGEGALLGSETQLIDQLQTSRATVRQAARLVEREGLLRVKRGANGGYFCARPSTQTIEHVVGAYLDSMSFDIEEMFSVTFVLWAEVLHQTAALRTTPDIEAMTRRFRKRLADLPTNATIPEIIAFEDDFRRAILDLVKRPFTELLFQLSRTVTWSGYNAAAFAKNDAAFLRAWRKAKRFEIEAIEVGDEGLMMTSAVRNRTLWYKQLLRRAVFKTRAESTSEDESKQSR